MHAKDRFYPREGRFYKLARCQHVFLAALFQPFRGTGDQSQQAHQPMKTPIFPALLALACLFACAEQDPKEGIAPDGQKWQLVRMTGSMINSETTGPDMAWQEYIVLAADASFLKSRQQNGHVKVARGSYSLATVNDEQYVVLNYTSGYELRASCHSGLAEEHVRVISPTKMVGTWNICDGPGLEYQRVEEKTIEF